MFCRGAFRASATSAGSRIVCAPGYCRSAAPGSTRPLPPKCLLSRSPRYGVARTAMGSCISSNRSRLPSFSLPNERSSIPLTPHRTWLGTARLACFPACPLFVRLQTRTEPPGAPFSIRPGLLKPLFGVSDAFQAVSRSPSPSLASSICQTIQTP